MQRWPSMADPYLANALKMNTIQLQKANRIAAGANRIAAAALLASLTRPVPQDLLDHITKDALDDYS